MRVYLTMTSGETLIVDHVESLRLVAFQVVEIKCFGNEPALTYRVQSFDIESFFFNI